MLTFYFLLEVTGEIARGERGARGVGGIGNTFHVRAWAGDTGAYAD